MQACNSDTSTVFCHACLPACLPVELVILYHFRLSCCLIGWLVISATLLHGRVSLHFHEVFSLKPFPACFLSIHSSVVPQYCLSAPLYWRAPLLETHCMLTNWLTIWALPAEFMGFEQQLQPVWLARDSERIWRGSYKNKAWKHLV